jgi:hypothetical protein
MRTSAPSISRWAGVALLAAVLGAGAAGALASVGVAGGSGDIHLTGSGAAAAAGPTTSEPAAAAGTPAPFAIKGKVTGLYPGASLPLVLTVSNPEVVKIVVTSITTTVSSPSAKCPASLVTVTPFSGKHAVLAHGSGHVTVTASLAHVAPNACKGVVFPFHYSGLANRL